VITADSITDEQIRELQRSIAGRVFPASGMAHTGLSEVWEACNLALGSNGREACVDRGYAITPHMREQARARCAEVLNARAASGRQCDFHDAHDAVADVPVGNRCVASATHRIEWSDGRYSFGCEAHLAIDESATVKPTRVVPLSASATTSPRCRAFAHEDHVSVACEGNCCTACGGPIDENEECRC
jgi:hypothetical protein